MQEQTLETSDERIGLKFIVGANGNYARISLGKLGDNFNVNDEVYVLSISEHQKLLQQLNDADNNIDEHTIEDLQHKVDNYKTTLGDKDSTIVGLKKEIKDHEQTIADLKQMNDNIAKEKDAIEKQLDNVADASEIEDLKSEIATLKEKLETSEKNAEYWQNSYNTLFESSDELTLQNESLISDNEKLRNDNNAINETNKLLNESVIGLKTSFDKTIEDKTTDAENTEKELKETIKKQQSHIDEITEKYQSLLHLKEYISPNEHHNEIIALKDEITKKEKEISDLNANIETKLATQKSELDIAHADEINSIKVENTESKAQMLVAYNQELNSLKVQYNNLANDYNHLLNGVDSLTRINTFFNGKHNEIKKDKEQVPMLEITSEQLPPSDENVLEYVPKD